MSRDETGRLLEALLDAKKAPDRQAAKERSVFYLMAMNTGLRWREIARLRWGDFYLDDAKVIVPAGQTKNGKQAELPLNDEVAAALREFCPPDASEIDLIFSAEPRLKTWKRDLQRAGIIKADGTGYRDGRGRQLDRKCLRMTFCTRLKEAGVDLRDAQALMRHCSPALTSNLYTDIRLRDLHAAVQKIQSGEENFGSDSKDQRAAG